MATKKASTPTPAAPVLLQTLFAPELLPNDEKLYIGIDIGKERHYAGFISNTLVKINRDWKHCPWMEFPRSREGFDALLTAIQQYVPLDRVTILFEHTGHYSRPIQDYLFERKITCYRQQVRERPNRMIKNDKRDAQALANLLYNTLEKGIQVNDRRQEIRLVVADTMTSSQLGGLIHHRYELVQQATRYLNQLTAICDQLFPELSSVIGNVNNQTALALRQTYPTAADFASATYEELRAHRVGTKPSDENLRRLPALAQTSIGCKDPIRAGALFFEQSHIIAMLRLNQAQQKTVEAEIERIVMASREGQILLSMPCFGVGQVGVLLSAIGNINRFESAAKLKSYFGWAPRQEQTGKTTDRTFLARDGNRLLKQTVYLAAMRVIRVGDNEWHATYERLVQQKCAMNDKGEYVGKMRCVASICGRIITMVYTLLKQDADLLANLKTGEAVPDPVFYSQEKHKGDIAAIQRHKKQDKQTEAQPPAEKAPVAAS